MTTRLIERYLPIAEIGIESVRERTPMTPFPAPNRLHVWWARRPLVASRAAILASILPEDADREEFKHALGIHGDPVRTRARLDAAKRTKEDLGLNPYGYPRAFKFAPGKTAAKMLSGIGQISILDPTAGGGAIPLEAMRLGGQAHANDLNPVAAFILTATIDTPRKFGVAIIKEYDDLCTDFLSRCKTRFKTVYPEEPEGGRVDGYLWARTITCPYCSGRVPLAPNWRLAPNGTGVRLHPAVRNGPGDISRICNFEIVENTSAHSSGTVAGGDGVCPYPDCGRAIDGDEIKRQANFGEMGDQIFAIVYKRPVTTKTKTGKNRVKWVRGYRAPDENDDNSEAVITTLAEKLPEWEVNDVVPTEAVPEGSKTDEARRFGMHNWRDMFSPRQLLAHGTGVEVFRDLVEEDMTRGALTPLRSAAYSYLAIAIDKLLNYNSRMSVWMPTREVVANTFNRHDFAFCWSYVEMALLIRGGGYDWAIAATRDAVGELVEMVAPGKLGDMLDDITNTPGTISITNGSGAAMPHIEDKSIDAIIMDPPYGANVMYAELSDFFYVW